MISALRGRSYTYDRGLSQNSENWYVVGVVDIPTRVDKVWGWRNPAPRNMYEKPFRPSFYMTSSYLCLPAIESESGWAPASNDAYFIPIFSVDKILESTPIGREPSIVEAPRFYFNDEDDNDPPQFIKLVYETWYLEEIHDRPLRIDKFLDWRDMKIDEEPVFVITSAGVGVRAFFQEEDFSWSYSFSLDSYNIPIFMITKVYEWREVSTVGPQGPAGIQGNTGPQGPQGPQGPSSPSGGGGGGFGGY